VNVTHHLVIVMDSRATPPRRFEWTTTDIETAREFLYQTYGGQLRASRRRNSPLVVSLTNVDAGQFSCSHVAVPGELIFKVTGHDSLTIYTVHGGAAEAAQGNAVERYVVGDAFIGNFPEAEYLCRTRDARGHVATLPIPLLGRVAGVSSERSLIPPAQSPLHAPRGDALTQWQHTIGYVDTMLANPAVCDSPLSLGNLARLLAGTALTAFLNTALRAPQPADRADTTPLLLRRAVAFIDDHAHTDIGAADVAAAIHVTPRAVQYMFRRHLDSTPSGYLRRVRLHHAHQELLASTPMQTTVSTVAARWGFLHAGRFSALYRQTYGESPYITLRRGL
jgi:AraC-like DNA-binding protein